MRAAFERSGRQELARLVVGTHSKAEPPVAGSPLTVVGCESDADSEGVRCRLSGFVSSLPEIARASGVESSEPPELLARAFARLGTGLLEYLSGRFVACLWSKRRSEGLIVRDPLGAMPIFTARWGDGLLLASEIVDLLDMLPRRPAPDRVALIDLLGQNPRADERTLYEGIAPLRSGHALVLERDRAPRTVRYWRPRYEARSDVDLEQAAERLRTAAAEEMVADPRPGKRGILLSGGIDSCTVAGAASTLPAGRMAVGAYSLTYPDLPEQDESPLIEQVAEQLGMSSTRAAVRDGSPLAFGLRFLERWGLPLVSMNGFAKNELLRAAHTDGVRVMLDGEGGDELFGLSPWLPADHLRAGRPRRAMAVTRRIPGAASQSDRVLVRHLLVRLAGSTLPVGLLARLRRPRSEWPVQTPAWLTADARRQLVAREQPQAWRELDGPRWWAWLAYSLCDYRDLIGHRHALRLEQRMAGLEGHHPLLDERLTELVLSLPGELAYDPLLDRPLARASMRGILPDAVRLRTAKSYFDPSLIRATVANDLPLYAELLRARDCELGSVIDAPTAARALLDAPRERYGAGADFWLGDLWRLGVAEAWLRSQADPGFPLRLAERVGPEAVVAWQRDGPK